MTSSPTVITQSRRPGAIGEYSGKFMSGQFVLKGRQLCHHAAWTRARELSKLLPSIPNKRWQFTWRPSRQAMCDAGSAASACVRTRRPSLVS